MMTADEFLADVAMHRLQILHDDGLYRHLRFRRPGSYCYGFDIVTYPGYLCYSGDMGCYVFSRLPDMFEFFRGDGPNPSYWAEKCVSKCRTDGLREYSETLGRRAVAARALKFARDRQLVGEDRAAFFGEVREEVWACSDDHRNLVDAAMGFRFQIGSRRDEVFPDFYEHQLEEWTTRFLWCCHALPWAIARYDIAKGGTDA